MNLARPETVTRILRHAAARPPMQINRCPRCWIYLTRRKIAANHVARCDGALTVKKR